jgi:hypothetical protein
MLPEILGVTYVTGSQTIIQGRIFFLYYYNNLAPSIFREKNEEEGRKKKRRKMSPLLAAGFATVNVISITKTSSIIIIFMMHDFSTRHYSAEQNVPSKASELYECNKTRPK